MPWTRLADIEIINTELALADLESCEKQLTKGCAHRQERRQGRGGA
jgi:ribosome-binding ATPase YchF (GTP1/OBG family)